MTVIDHLMVAQALFAGFCAGYCFFHEKAPPQIAAWTWLVLTLAIIYTKLI